MNIRVVRNNSRQIESRLISAICLILWGMAAANCQTAESGQHSDPLHSFSNSVRALVRKINPSVVQVFVTGYGPVENQRSDTSLVLGKQQAIGSGVIVSADGFILTNFHVVQSGRRIQVNVVTPSRDESPDEALISGRGRLYEATVVGSDQEIDLALLKIDATGLPALPFADYNKLRQGDIVFAFGSPEGLQNSVSMGVVSATSRQPDEDSPMVFIQTDAPINPGNSGGPLVNVDGELVGINTFILSQGGGNEGLGFAIPSSAVEFAYPQLKKYGHVHRGETGMSVQAITPGLAAGLKLPKDWAVIVSDVVPGGPAEKAGVKILDIVTSVDGQPAASLPTIANKLLMRRADEVIKLGILRSGQKLTLEVKVAEQLHEVDRLADLVNPEKSLVAKLGIIGLEIDAKISALVPGLRIQSGVVIAAKAANPSVDTPLETGDVIHAVNSQSVTSVDGLRSLLDHLGPNVPAVLQIEREGHLMLITVQID